jgi:5'-nucleotidase
MSTKERPLILITNDDGIYAKGIAALSETAKKYGDVVVITANQSFSGMSHAITVYKPLYYKLLKKEEGITWYETNGTPADCVKLGINKILNKTPDLILSGINHGDNSSISVHYSGTIGAVREGCLNGIPSIGFSLLSYDKDADFTESKQVADKVLSSVLDNSFPEDTFLSVNIPYTAIKGIKTCRQAKGKWVEEFIERVDPHGNKYYWLSGHFVSFEPKANDTDEYFLKNNYATVVPCKIDATHYSAMKALNWE